jgi:hypothetical protein
MKLPLLLRDRAEGSLDPGNGEELRRGGGLYRDPRAQGRPKPPCG